MSVRQIEAILPGLNFIVTQYSGWRKTKKSLYSLRPHFYRRPKAKPGKHYPEIMKEIVKLWSDLNETQGKSRRLWVNTLQIRAAIYALRLRQDYIRHYPAHSGKEESLNVRSLLECDPIRSVARRVRRTLERHLKRANRLLRQEFPAELYVTIMTDWRSALQWIRFELAYFQKARIETQQRKVQRHNVQTAVDLAKLGIAEHAFQPPGGGQAP